MRRVVVVGALFALLAPAVWMASWAEDEPMLGLCYDMTDPWHPRSVNKITLQSQECDHKMACGITMICDMFQTPCYKPGFGVQPYPYTHVGDDDVIMTGSCRYLLYHNCQMCPKVLVCYRRRGYQRLVNGACKDACERAYYEGRVGGCVD